MSIVVKSEKRQGWGRTPPAASGPRDSSRPCFTGIHGDDPLVLSKEGHRPDPPSRVGENTIFKVAVEPRPTTS